MSAAASLVAGLLAGSLFLAGLCVGGGVLRLIGRLTGGSWSESHALDRIARLATLPVLSAVIAAAVLHLWIGPAPGPAQAWRSLPFTTVRLGLIGAAWLWITWLSSRRPSQAASGLALLVFGLSVSLAAFDMVLSLEPGWVSSAEGMALAVRMLGAALAAALLTGAPAADALSRRDRRDLCGLLAATLLATAYLSLMSYLIPWYGDLPEKTAWIRLRADAAWRVLIAAAIGAGALLPLPLLALSRRVGERGVQTAAALSLFGFLGQTVWLVAPPFGWIAASAGLAGGVIAVSGFWLSARPRRVAHAL